MEHNIYKTVFKVKHSEGTGSCFYLKSRDLFVTNYHVVEGSRKVAIKDNEDNVYLAHVVLVNSQADIALLRVESDFSDLPEITLAADNEVAMGNCIFVAGYPFGMPLSVTKGMVSSPKQLVNGKYLIQTDAAVNPGNSGGPMFNERNELVAITTSKLGNADGIGFGIPAATLLEVLHHAESITDNSLHLQCPSCEELIAEHEEYCPSCGSKCRKEIFKESELTKLAATCEQIISDMGINPIVARNGNERWEFHKGSVQIRLFVYNSYYIFCTSPINLLPKKNVESALTYLLSEDWRPYQMGVDDNEIYFSYRIHISELFGEQREQVMLNFVNFAHKADELDNMLTERFNCEFSEHTKMNAI